MDPVYQVRWAGSSVGGPDGDLRWGLDADDYALTGNRVCMDTYLAPPGYIDHCQANGYPTKVFFTTGPVDGGGNTGENGYQRHLKHQHIRDYVHGRRPASPVRLRRHPVLEQRRRAEHGHLDGHGGTPRSLPHIHADNMLD